MFLKVAVYRLIRDGIGRDANGRQDLSEKFYFETQPNRQFIAVYV